MSSVVQPPAPPKLPHTPIPPVGWTVWWYEQGQVNRRPLPADVTAAASYGTIDLLITRPDGSRRTVRGAWYVHDPQFAKSDHHSRGEKGCWDYIPGHYYDVNRPEDSPLAKLEARVKELERLVAPKTPPAHVEGFNLEETVMELTAKGRTPAQIAEEVMVNIQQVNAIIRRRGK